MPSVERHNPPHLSDYEAAIRARLRLDVRDRQLAILRNTFPYWNIRYEHDRFGRCSWTAALVSTPMAVVVTAGVAQEVQCRDPVELMAVLTVTVLAPRVRSPNGSVSPWADPTIHEQHTD
jgi:hypothetical protein